MSKKVFLEDYVFGYADAETEFKIKKEIFEKAFYDPKNIVDKLINDYQFILIGRLTIEYKELEVNLQEQLKIKRLIEEIIYDYEITSKETALVTSDLEAKINKLIQQKKLLLIIKY